MGALLAAIKQGVEVVNNNVADENHCQSKRTMEQEDRKSFREYYIKAYYSINRSYDKSVLTIAGGGLALFTGFIGEVVEDLSKAKHVILMKFSWSFFAVSMFFIMVRLYAGSESHMVALKQLNTEEEEEKKMVRLYGESHSEKEEEQVGGTWTTVGWWCFLFSAVSLLLGLVMAISFIWINMGK